MDTTSNAPIIESSDLAILANWVSIVTGGVAVIALIFGAYQLAGPFASKKVLQKLGT